MGASRVFANLGKLAGFATIGGFVIAVGVFPALYALSSTASYASNQYLSLPSALRTPPTFQTSHLYASDGRTLITSFYDENRTDVPLSAVSVVMRQAVIAAEDARFYSHGGVDVQAIARAFVADERGGELQQGASTLTMQYVRNVLKTDPDLTPAQRVAATEDTIGRKVREARYASALEGVLTKDEILERYLNIVYFGDRAYGVDAAARTYFDTTPDKLTLGQAAMLAGIIQSPDLDNPVVGDPGIARERRTYVLDALARAHLISPAEATAVATSPLGLHPTTQPADCTEVSKAHNSWGFFCDWFVRWWEAQPAFGATVDERAAALRDGGYRIVTSMSPKVQDAATKQALAVYGYASPKALPIAVVTPGSGRVLALSVNRHYSLADNPLGQRDYPNTVNQLIAGGSGAYGYQSGSTFKLFTMLAALELGKPLNTSFTAPARLVTHFPDSGPSSCHGVWCPVNANPTWMDGKRNLWTGFGRSVNTFYVWLEEQIGPQYAVAMAQRLGMVFRAPGDAAQARDNAAKWGAFTLGVADTTPLDLANAYATVASGGIYCKPLPVLSIVDRSGAKLAAADPQCTRAISADVAAAAADAARCPVTQQSYYRQCNGGTAPVIPSIIGSRPFGGKTGSSDNNATETFVGFTPQVAAAGIAADPANPRDFVGSGVSHFVDVAVGRTLAVALAGLPYVDFPAPSLLIAFGPHVVKVHKPPKRSKPGRSHRPM